MNKFTLFKGRKKGVIHTMNITFDDIRACFFPKNFNEKYKYLGYIPWQEDDDLFLALEPLVVYMDYKAKPRFCPRWFLRFLHLFGNDNSIVRVRNWKLSRLHSRLTKGIKLVDFKTKWEHYDLRISVHGDNRIHDLAEDIEEAFYNRGLEKEVIEDIKKIEPDFNEEYLCIDKLLEYLKKIK